MLETSFEPEKTCRACTKTGIELSSIFTKQDDLDEVSFSDMITECTMYTVLEDDELPQLICNECIDKVRIAFYFKRQCEASHRKLLSLKESLREILKTKKAVDTANKKDDKNEEIPQEDNIPRRRNPKRTSFRKYRCEKCERTCTTLALLKIHVSREHKLPRIKCPICPKEFIYFGKLKGHISKFHDKEGVPVENTITETFVKTEAQSVVRPEITTAESDADDMDFSFGAHDGDNHIEDNADCISIKDDPEAIPVETNTEKLSATTEEKIQIKDEEENHVKEETVVKRGRPKTKPTKTPKSPSKVFVDSNRQFQCDQCHKSFKRKSHLQQHSLCHSKLKPHQCTICDKRFGRQDNLKVHMSNHGLKQFQCNACDRTFGQAYLLKRHKEQAHGEEKPFLCSQCGQRFVRNGDLAVHMRRHTGEKPYKCQYCNKGFTRSTEVYVHERYHTGEKRHVCNICGKAFQRPYNLLVHVRTHTGERPYQCPHCPKNFAQCSDLKAHIRRHTGERYRCDLCGMGFIHVFVLNQHKFSVHGIEVQSRIKRIAKLSTDTQ